MGAGSAKTHQSFAVTPSSAVEPEQLEQPAGGLQLEAQENSPAGEVVSATAGLEDSVVALLSVSEEEKAAFLAAIGIGDVPLHADTGEHAAGAAPAGDAADVATAPSGTLIPVPEAPVAGDPLGIPVLLAGGTDLEDGSATLVAYAGPGGPREVLLAHVSPEAEAKLLEALDVAGKLVPVQVEHEVIDTLPSDTYHATIEPAAKAINAWLKHGAGDPAAAAATLAEVHAAIDQRLAMPDVSEAEKAMLLSYRGQIEAYQVAAAGPGGKQAKLPKVLEHKGPVTKLVTEHVPAPSSGEGLPAVRRTATRIAAAIDADGTARWNGASRATAPSGVEYAVNLGDGYTAVYRPYGDNQGSHDPYSLRGALEMSAPAGAGHGRELVRRLERLHLIHQPMTVEEGEAAYLRANVAAQGLQSHPAVVAALAPRPDLEQLAQQEVFNERAHEVVGLSTEHAARLSREIVLEAERRVLSHRLPELRDAVAAATGHPGGEALRASPGYDPQPRRSGGWFTWGRFDVAAHRDKVRKAFGTRVLSHRLSSSTSAADLVRNGGVLASTERRRLMGIHSGIGMSESADQASGGARSVFLRVSGKAAGGDVLEWHDPALLLSRSDWYAYSGDHFGSLNPKDHHYSESSMTRDPFVAAKNKGASNEVMFRQGLDLLGSEAPSRIRCSTKKRAEATLAALAARGITHLGGTPVAEVVVWA